MSLQLPDRLTAQWRVPRHCTKVQPRGDVGSMQEKQGILDEHTEGVETNTRYSG